MTTIESTLSKVGGLIRELSSFCNRPHVLHRSDLQALLDDGLHSVGRYHPQIYLNQIDRSERMKNKTLLDIFSPILRSP